jgi:hypothetical protein
VVRRGAADVAWGIPFGIFGGRSIREAWVALGIWGRVRDVKIQAGFRMPA